jgi:hypothetical protein
MVLMCRFPVRSLVRWVVRKVKTNQARMKED